jgi:hypothetical protein
MIVLSPDMPTPPGKVAVHILIELHPPLFVSDVWISLEKYFLDNKSKQLINIVPVTNFAKLCQYLLDIMVGEPLFLNYNREMALEMLKCHRLRQSLEEFDRPVDPQLVTEGRFFRQTFLNQYGLKKKEEAADPDILSDDSAPHNDESAYEENSS